ncbi:MAG: hypothetical protein GY761_17270 [Hyphomicrobiales bacterium]|nr:hypothetical protein [Hyphomicrobiales bacterium]
MPSSIDKLGMLDSFGSVSDQLGEYKNRVSRLIQDIIGIFKIPASRRPFISDRQGNVAVIFAIALTPVIMASAMAVEYSRFSSSYTDLMSSADGALLAASIKMAEQMDLDDEQLLSVMETEFDNHMGVNFDGSKHQTSYTYNMTFDRDERTVSVDINLTQNGVYSSVFGDKKLSATPTLGTKLTTIPENYVLDIVMCIDATGSMQNTLNSVQQNAATFDTQLRSELGLEANDPRFKIRVRPIYFRDWKDTYYHNTRPRRYRDGLIMASDFYDLDDSGDTSAFQSFLNSEYASGGFDYPEASGACMNEGMRSNWYDVENQTDFPEDENLTVFPIIVVWTDNSIQQLWRTQSYMSATQPTSYTSFEAQWNNPAIIPQDPKLLILFGPQDYSGWSTVKNWNNYVHGGSIWQGNSSAISIIADQIVKALPDNLRLTH